jgi:SnoaL-like domain
MNVYFLKYTTIATIIFCIIGCANKPSVVPNNEQQIATLLDGFNIAAAKADYNTYFNYFDDDAIFIGTDATERWNKQAFMIWAKPYFDKKTTWNFTTLQRHIYIDTASNIAWFDELLETQMKICRGSGVLKKQENEWKIKQYVLSTSVPNKILDSVIHLKTDIEDTLINTLKAK